LGGGSGGFVGEEDFEEEEDLPFEVPEAKGENVIYIVPFIFKLNHPL
jgi:hypothetical protein